MICSHCGKEIERFDRYRIIKELPKGNNSITSLSKLFNTNRSAMRYYLESLKEEGLIVFERQQNLPGRPTFVKIMKLNRRTQR